MTLAPVNSNRLKELLHTLVGSVTIPNEAVTGHLHNLVDALDHENALPQPAPVGVPAAGVATTSDQLDQVLTAITGLGNLVGNLATDLERVKQATGLSPAPETATETAPVGVPTGEVPTQ